MHILIASLVKSHLLPTGKKLDQNCCGQGLHTTNVVVQAKQHYQKSVLNMFILDKTEHSVSLLHSGHVVINWGRVVPAQTG
jgi:hypothetical protein